MCPCLGWTVQLDGIALELCVLCWWDFSLSHGFELSRFYYLIRFILILCSAAWLWLFKPFCIDLMLSKASMAKLTLWKLATRLSLANAGSWMCSPDLAWVNVVGFMEWRFGSYGEVSWWKEILEAWPFIIQCYALVVWNKFMQIWLLLQNHWSYFSSVLQHFDPFNHTQSKGRLSRPPGGEHERGVSNFYCPGIWLDGQSMLADLLEITPWRQCAAWFEFLFVSRSRRVGFEISKPISMTISFNDNYSQGRSKTQTCRPCVCVCACGV